LNISYYVYGYFTQEKLYQKEFESNTRFIEKLSKLVVVGWWLGDDL